MGEQAGRGQTVPLLAMHVSAAASKSIQAALTSPLPACPLLPATRSPLPWTVWWSRCRPRCRPRSRPTPVGGLGVVNQLMLPQSPRLGALGPTSLPPGACLPNSSV